MRKNTIVVAAFFTLSFSVNAATSNIIFKGVVNNIVPLKKDIKVNDEYKIEYYDGVSNDFAVLTIDGDNKKHSEFIFEEDIYTGAKILVVNL